MSALGAYADALGVVVEPSSEAAPVVRLSFGDHLVGRPGFLHGGVVAGLLEIAAVATLRRALGEEAVRLSLVTVGVDYLRGGRPVETRASARIVRLGRRIANLEVLAWQAERDRPIAAARVNLLIGRPGEG